MKLSENRSKSFKTFNMKFNLETIKKTDELENFARNLFINEYESKWSNQNVDLADE